MDRLKNYDKAPRLAIVILLIVSAVMVARLRGQGTPPVETRPLSAEGQKDANSIHWEIVKAQQKINGEIVALQAAELARQKLTVEGGWTLDFDKDQIERRAPLPTPPGPGTAPPPAAEKPKAK